MSQTQFITLDNETEYADNQHSRLGIEVITKDYVERGALGETDFFFGELKGRDPIRYETSPIYWSNIKRNSLERLLKEQWRFLTRGMLRVDYSTGKFEFYLQKLSLKQKITTIFVISKLKWRLFWLPKAKEE